MGGELAHQIFDRLFVGAVEFVEVVIAQDGGFIGNRPVKHEFGVASDRSGAGKQPFHAQKSGCREDLPAVQIDAFRGNVALFDHHT